MLFLHNCLMMRLLLMLLLSVLVSGAFSVGVNYGQIANNLPPPAEVRQLVESTIIKNVKIFDANPLILNAFAGSPIELIIMAGNDRIIPFATAPDTALAWVLQNVVPYPLANIKVICLGNEVLASDAASAPSLLTALQNLHQALVSQGLDQTVKVTTPHSMGILSASDPPSSGAFSPSAGLVILPLLGFLAQIGSSFMVNVYPFFAYLNSPGVSLNFCLFQPLPSEVRVDAVTGLAYNNMFDAQVDAVYHAMARAGFPDLKIIVGESGWPSKGAPNDLTSTITNAQLYNSHLISHLQAGSGTPWRPAVALDTYIFALFNENLKPGNAFEPYFGLFYPNKTLVYPSGIM